MAVESAIPRQITDRAYQTTGHTSELILEWMLHTRRGRRTVIAAALIAGDLASAIVMITVQNSLYGLSAARAAVGSLPLFFVAMWILGMYGACTLAPFERVRYRTMAAALCFAANLFISVRLSISAAAPFLQTFLLFLMGFYAEIIVRSLLVRVNVWGAPTALVGTKSAVAKVHQLLSLMPQFGLRPVGRLGIKESSMSVDKDPTSEIAFLGELTRVSQITRPEIEFVVTTNESDFVHVKNAVQAVENPPEVVLVNDAAKLPHHALLLTPGYLNLALSDDRENNRMKAGKRLIDLLIGILLFLLAAPIIGVLALAVKTVDPGPAFYFHTRIGLNGRSLRVVKVRSMFQDADAKLELFLSENPEARGEWRRFCKLAHDPRVLPYIGTFMRHFSLDELPQLWQVVTGELSLVGPRPFPSYHASHFDPEFQTLRVSVLPGVTGLWQVSSRSRGDIQIQKVEDLYYIQNRSIWFDLYLLLMTVPAILSGRTAPHARDMTTS